MNEKSIYEIIKDEKVNLFDFVLKPRYTDNDEFEQYVKRQIGSGLDVMQLNQRIEYFNDFGYLILDRDAFANDDRYIVQMFKSIVSFMQDTKPIFIWIDIPEDLKKELIDICEDNHKLLNLISSETLDEQKEEILECFSEKGMQRYITSWKTSENENFEKYNFRLDSIYGIEMLSTTSDIISKSISLSLCMYLNEVGAKVNYNCPLYNNNELNAIARLIGAEKQDEYYKMDNIYLSNNLEAEIKDNTNFIIQDLGYIKEDMLEGLQNNNIDNDNFDKKIILCDLNILEIDLVKYIYYRLGNKVYLANSTNKYINPSQLSGKDKEDFEDIDRQLKIKKLDKQQDLIDIRTNRNFFNALIEPNIIK